MEPVYQQEFLISDNCVDCFGKLKPSMILYYVQEAAGKHFDRISMDYEALANLGMFWAIIRQRVQITRIPNRGETIRLETWPMPTTKVAYPRSVVAYDEAGREVFRSISIWVLMDYKNRKMILPGKSGISVPGTLRGGELATPASLSPALCTKHQSRTVAFTDLDRNGHMNNTRCMEWLSDLLPSIFHHSHSLKEFTVCYLSEARESEILDLRWDFIENGILQLDASRRNEGKTERVFSVRAMY